MCGSARGLAARTTGGSKAVSSAPARWIRTDQCRELFTELRVREPSHQVHRRVPLSLLDRSVARATHPPSERHSWQRVGSSDAGMVVAAERLVALEAEVGGEHHGAIRDRARALVLDELLERERNQRDVGWLQLEADEWVLRGHGAPALGPFRRITGRNAQLRGRHPRAFRTPRRRPRSVVATRDARAAGDGARRRVHPPGATPARAQPNRPRRRGRSGWL